MIGSARIYVAGTFAGILSKSADDFIFTYDPSYPRDGRPVSLRLLPALSEHVNKGRLHAFFEGLMYEGWLSRLAARGGNVGNDTGLVGYLISHCVDSIGDVEITASEILSPAFTPAFSIKAETSKSSKSRHDRCLICCESLPRAGHNSNYHEHCSLDFFGSEIPPYFDLGADDVERLAVRSIASGIALPGVQPKLPVYLPASGAHFILKPQVQGMRAVPECEHLWMRLFASLGVNVARSALVELQDGNLAYVTRRFDRQPNGLKLHVEDFAQLLGKSILGNEKFDASIRDIAAAIRLNASIRLRKNAIERLIDLTVLNFIFGNGDAHLKNHALIGIPDPAAVGGVVYTLSPAYDLLPTTFLESSNSDEAALAINGKRRLITMQDLIAESVACGLDGARVEAKLKQVQLQSNSVEKMMQNSFVPRGKVDELLKQINGRIKYLNATHASGN